MPSPVLVIDVAHPPRNPDDVEADLIRSWSVIRNSNSLRILKVIHGRGSTGKGGSTRDVVRNWAFTHRGRFRAVIDGEQYALLDPDTLAMRQEVGAFPDTDLGAGNGGITCLWIK